MYENMSIIGLALKEDQGDMFISHMRENQTIVFKYEDRICVKAARRHREAPSYEGVAEPRPSLDAELKTLKNSFRRMCKYVLRPSQQGMSQGRTKAALEEADGSLG